MNISYAPIVGLAAVDLFLLVLYWVYLRASPPLNRRALTGMAAGMMGFVFHAFLFFSGAFLFLQLATIASVVGMSLLSSRKRLPSV